ncbi:MAG: hypothetical protein NT094_00850 [Candidatus Staskawiczbacteria bacterium]|nr:hypothetical protein [Candidatus Staskawiczbacteria bacterium]
MDKRKILFLAIFTILGLIAFQVVVNKIVGSSQNFTLFELLGPTGGTFLGPILGAISVFFVRALNVIILHQKLDLLTVIRFLPMMLAAVYFGIKTKKTAIIFPICIALFLLNPIGRQAWMYSMIWLIPFFATFFNKRRILKSLGATFTAHAVGSVIFLYTFGLTPAMWIALIPVVFIERGVFTLGIWTSCLVLNNVLDKLTNLKMVSFLKPLVNENYLISQKFFKSFA